MQSAAVRGGSDAALGYIGALWRHRWLILLVCAAAVATALVVTVRTPKVYESTTTLLVPRETDAGGVLGSLAASGVLQQVPGLSGQSFAPTRDMLISILRSRTMAEAVIAEFRLHERLGQRFREDTVRHVQAATRVTLSLEGVIAVRVEDTDPKLAADMANFYVVRLDALASELGTGEAGRQRTFVAGQLARARAALDRDEETLRRFQEQNRAVVLQEQTRGAVEAAARLKGEIMAAEVQQQVMRGFATDTNPEMISLARRLQEMKRQLLQMQYGDDERATSRDISVPFAKVPGVGLELARLTRQVKIQETLVTLLTQQLEQLKISEAKDLPIVRVLDRAVPAEQHSRPRLSLNLLVSGIIGLLMGVALAALVEYRSARHPC